MIPIFLKRRNYVYLPDYNCLINCEIKDTFLKNLKKIIVENTNIDEKVIKSRFKNLRQLIFEITQDCNLNCRYCAFSGIYNFKRRRNKKSLNINIAKRALIYIYNFIKDRKEKEFVIGFYGGEPLLNFDIIKMIVEFSKGLFSGWNLRYSLSTNLTLLNRQMIDFFINNKFEIQVSLDRPAENHDAKRIFHNGKGTFDCIMNKLETIKEINDYYYQNNIQFEAVYSKDLSLKKVYDFFITNELVKMNDIILSFVNESDTNYYIRFPYNKARFIDEHRMIFDAICEKIGQKINLCPIESDFISIFSVLLDDLNVKKFSNLFGTCLFDIRLFLDVNGIFHVCEKINHLFPLGKVWDGLNFGRMSQIAINYINVLNKKCKNCEVKYLCHRCYVAFAKKGKFEIDDEFCKKTKRSIINSLEYLIQLKEEEVIV